MISEELKAMDFGRLLDRSFKMFFSSIKQILKISLSYAGINLGIILIGLLILAGVFYFNYGSFFFSMDGEDIYAQLLFASPILIIIMFINIITAVFFYGMIHDLYINTFLEDEWSFKKSIIKVKGKFWPIFLNGFLYLIFYSLLGVCCLFFPLMVFLTASIPAMLFENIKSDGIGRSFSLVGRNFWGVLGTKLVYSLIISGISILAIIVAGLITFVVLFILIAVNLISSNDSETISIWLMIIFVISYIPLVMFLNIIECALNVLIFFNQKIKYENFGVEFLANSIIDDNPVEIK